MIIGSRATRSNSIHHPQGILKASIHISIYLLIYPSILFYVLPRVMQWTIRTFRETSPSFLSGSDLEAGADVDECPHGSRWVAFRYWWTEHQIPWHMDQGIWACYRRPCGDSRVAKNPHDPA